MLCLSKKQREWNVNKRLVSFETLATLSSWLSLLRHRLFYSEIEVLHLLLLHSTIMALGNLLLLYLVLYLSESVLNTAAGLSKRSETETVDSPTICTTDLCSSSAQQILNSIDENVDPCDDFYKFACGKFIREAPIPDDRERIDSLSMIKDRVYDQLKEYLLKGGHSQEPTLPRLVKDFYGICLNGAGEGINGLKPLLDIMKKLGGWPVLEGDNWNEENFKWPVTVQTLQDEGYTKVYLVRLKAHEIMYEKQTKLVWVLEHPDYMNLNDPNTDAHYRHLVQVAVFLGADRDRAEKELKEAVEFQKLLANMASLFPNFEKTSIEKLSEENLFSDLHGILIILREQLDTMYLDRNETIVISDHNYFIGLLSLINKTPKRVLANYLMYQAALDSVRLLIGDEILDVSAERGEELFNDAMKKDRHNLCIDITIKSMPAPLYMLHSLRYLKTETRKDIVNLAEDIEWQFSNHLEYAEWMDTKTREIALGKLNSMATNNNSYSDELMDNNALRDLYYHVVVRENFLECFLSANRVIEKSSLDYLRRSMNRVHAWAHHLQTPRLYAPDYVPDTNTLVLPAVSLIPSFTESPKFLKYGTVGQMIGRAMAHSFVGQGRFFEYNGETYDWWSEVTKANFNSKKECVMNQYRDYTQNDKTLENPIIMYENIADITGIQVAYWTYKNSVKSDASEPTLPGLAYTPNQMFWISSVSLTQCAKYRNMSDLNKQLDDVRGIYNPGEYHVLGPFSNIPELAADFDCPVESKMNPLQKCTEW